MDSKLLLIDGHSMAFRAFYAMKGASFVNSQGQHTNAVFAFFRMISKLVQTENPTHIGVAFDLSGKTFRSDLFPDYKAQREAAPEEFHGQVDLIKKVLEALKVPVYTKEGYEADDILASISVAATQEGFSTYILTGDRDYFQLVNDHVTVLYPKKGTSDLIRFDPKGVKDKYGLTPAQYPDFAALRGDPSDNMPGVPGVGEKTAQKWITQFGDLTTLCENADTIKTKAGASFRECIEQVQLNRRITEMVKDLSFEPGFEAMAAFNYEEHAAQEIFDFLNFGTSIRTEIKSAFARKEKLEVTVADKDQNLDQWLALMQGEKNVPFYVHSDSTYGAWIAFSSAQHGTIVKKLTDLNPTEEKALAQFLSSDQTKVSHDVKNAWHILKAHGYALAACAHDTLIAAYLLNAGTSSYDLVSLAAKYLQHNISIKTIDKKNPFSDEEFASNLGAHALVIAEILPTLLSSLEAEDALELYTDLEMPLTMILARMEDRGVAVDKEKLESLLADYENKVDNEVTAARQLVGEPSLNLSSPKQLQKVLFETLTLPKTKKTKTGYSTAAKELESLAVNHPHPFLDHLLAHREYQKLKTTVEGLVRAIGSDARIHTTFNQTATATGRLSSVEPNLQNIPVRTDIGRLIRSCFIAGPDYSTLLTADYSQIEMRVMTHSSNDAGLIDAYQRGEDLHNYVGSKVFDVSPEEVTPELRRRVKAMSYGLVYGLSSYGLAEQLGISPAEASRIMNNYFLRFGGVKNYLDNIVAQASQEGYTTTLFGRRRYLPDLNSSVRAVREAAERAALNAPIQGTAADIIKKAMIKVDTALTEAGLRSRLLLQIHDELMVEVFPGEEEQVCQIVQQNMDDAVSLRVPLEVSVGMGSNWEEAAH